MQAHIVHEDTYDSVIDYPNDDYLEVRWYDGSSDFVVVGDAGSSDGPDHTQRAEPVA